MDALQMGKSEQQFNDYLSEMRQESTWGSDIELRACGESRCWPFVAAAHSFSPTGAYN
jgi:hypothetical protein